MVLGAVLSYWNCDTFSPLLFVSTLAAVLAVNGAGNMVNTYFDFMRRRDSPSEKTRQRALAHRDIEPTQVVNFAAYLYGFGMVCLWMLIWLSKAKSEHLAALFFGGLSSSFLYTGGIGLKHYILGDLLVMFTFGPLSVLFSYVAQCGGFSWGPLFLALPLALSTEAILHSKNAREIDSDREAGVLSLAVLLGKQGSYLLYALLLFVPYLTFICWSVLYSLPLGLPILTMPYFFQLEKKYRQEGPTDKEITVRTAKLNFAIGMLFSIGCLLASDIPFLQS